MSEPNFEYQELSKSSPNSSSRKGRSSASPTNSIPRPSTFRDANSEHLTLGANLESGSKNDGPSPTAPKPCLPFDQPEQCEFLDSKDPASSSAPPDYRQSIGWPYPPRGSNRPPTWQEVNRAVDLGPESALPTSSDTLEFTNGIGVQNHPYDLSMYTSILIH